MDAHTPGLHGYTANLGALGPSRNARAQLACCLGQSLPLAPLGDFADLGQACMLAANKGVSGVQGTVCVVHELFQMAQELVVSLLPATEKGFHTFHPSTCSQET